LVESASTSMPAVTANVSPPPQHEELSSKRGCVPK
jgi:hypothetical protein